jgi:hypothetical protein
MPDRMMTAPPALLSYPGIAYWAVLLAVVIVVAIMAAAVAADEHARREAYLHSPLRAGTQHCAQHHGEVVRAPSGERYCRILVL